MVKKGEKGIPQTEEARKKISVAMKRIALEQIARGERKSLFKVGHKVPDYTGENNPNWKNGKSVGRIRRLKEEIRKRDGFICQECFTSQDELKISLDVHHIDFDKKNNNPNNLISLCHVCHAKTNFNRNDWINHFQFILYHRNSSSILGPTLSRTPGQVGDTLIKTDGGRTQ